MAWSFWKDKRPEWVQAEERGQSILALLTYPEGRRVVSACSHPR